jgi:DedD protein
MALLDKGLRQRMVGALVLVALAVIFLPMLFSREDELQRVVVDAPAMPQAPAMPSAELDPVSVPQVQDLPQEPVPGAGLDASAPVVEAPAVAVAEPAATKPAAAAEVAPVPVSRLDANGLAVSWSVQLASLSSRASAESLQQTLRGTGYNAYIRNVDGMNRVFVGPVIERAEADRLRDQLTRLQKLNGFVVRFQPERG